LANNQSQKKRNRQNEKRRIQNSQVKNSLRTSSKKINSAVEAKEDANSVKDSFKLFVKKLDTAARKGIINKKTAARKKSRLAKKVNSLEQQA